MTTAIDTSVLLAISKGEDGHERWLDGLAERASVAPLIACDVVWAEVGGFFKTFDRLSESLELCNIGFDPISAETSIRADRLLRTYRDQGGPREHLVPDFPVGAHAQLQASGLLAVDRGFFRRDFRELEFVRLPRTTVS